MNASPQPPTYLKNKLTDYLTTAEPFGPVDASLVRDPYCRRMLFQKENKIYTRMRQRPTIIIGRKGSGKTAFLHSSHQEGEYKCVIDINSASAFAAMLRAAQSIGTDSRFVEPVAKVWEAVFWLALVHHTRQGIRISAEHELFPSPQLRASLSAYISGLDAAPTHSTAQFLAAALQKYRDAIAASGSPPEDTPDVINGLQVAGHTLEQLKQKKGVKP